MRGCAVRCRPCTHNTFRAPCGRAATEWSYVHGRGGSRARSARYGFSPRTLRATLWRRKLLDSTSTCSATRRTPACLRKMLCRLCATVATLWSTSLMPALPAHRLLLPRSTTCRTLYAAATRLTSCRLTVLPTHHHAPCMMVYRSVLSTEHSALTRQREALRSLSGFCTHPIATRVKKAGKADS